MTDSMNVRVRLRGEEFIVPCAEGDQNIKWLSLAAVRLFSEAHKHGFCLRQRERFTSEGGVVLPHNVRRLGAKESLEPRDTINTTLEDGETVEVVVQKDTKIGRNGIPEPTKFHATAFLTSDVIHRRLKERIESEQRTLRAELEKERARKAEAEARIFGSIDEGTKEAFQIEFQKIVSKNFVPEDEQEDLKETLARYFEEVDAIFKHFAGFYVGEPGPMPYSAFVHTMHKTRVLDITKEVNVVKKLMQESQIDLEKSVYPDGTLSRGQFSELLIRMAVFKFNDQPMADALDSLMQEFMLPFLDVNRMTDIQQTIESSDAYEISRSQYSRLQRTFCRYVSSQSKSSQKFGPGTLTQAEFKQLLRDAGIIPKKTKRGGRNSGSGGVGARGGNQSGIGPDGSSAVKVEEETFATTAFFKAQKDEHSQSDLADLQELTFTEFVEALMWFGILYQSARSDYTDPLHMSMAKRVEAFEALVGEIVFSSTQNNSGFSGASSTKKGK